MPATRLHPSHLHRPPTRTKSDLQTISETASGGPLPSEAPEAAGKQEPPPASHRSQTAGSAQRPNTLFAGPSSSSTRTDFQVPPLTWTTAGTSGCVGCSGCSAATGGTRSRSSRAGTLPASPSPGPSPGWPRAWWVSSGRPRGAMRRRRLRLHPSS